MAPSDIASKLRRQPFMSLRIHLSDGSAHDVPKPYFASINVTELHVGVDPNENGIPKRTVYCDTRRVTQIEPLPSAAAENGR